MRAQLRSGAERGGGVLGYPLPLLYEEVAFVAYHFHWPAETILNFDHHERLQWVKEISAINEKRNNERSDAIEAQPIFS
jgi:hypothetical protein